MILCIMLQLQAPYAIESLLYFHQEPWVPRTNPIRQAISQFRGFFFYFSFFFFHAPTHNANSNGEIRSS